MSKHTVALATALCALVGQAVSADQRSVLVPDEPAERFTVLVVTQEPDDPDAKYPMRKVVDEIKKRVKKHKKWFLVSDLPDKAEIEMEVLKHTVTERMRTSMEYRVDPRGVGKHLVDVNTLQEYHSIEVRVSLPGEVQVLLSGKDEEVKGGSLKRAAQNLADNLEALIKDRYWELSEARVKAPEQ